MGLIYYNQFTKPIYRKHEKRHQKPYGCTFTHCTKKFGSKNDWKRHENSQHFQLEVWKCNEKTSAAGLEKECGKACFRREQFRTHLERDHKITSPDMANQKLKECLVGNDLESKFWCGFCNKVVEAKEKGLKSWTSRFNHIDDHFSGRGCVKMNISEWKTDPRVSKDGLDEPRSDDEESTELSSAPSTGGHGSRRSLKRPADGEARHRQRPSRKRVRTLYYCVSIDMLSNPLSFLANQFSFLQSVYATIS